MSIGQRINFPDALKKTSKNKVRIFAKRAGSTDSGFERSNLQVPDVRISPKFKLKASDRFFTIGSCFARNIEIALARRNILSLTSNYVFDDAMYEQTGVGARNGALNAYTPASMLDLLRFTRRPDAATVGSLQLGEDGWCDMLMSGLRFLSGAEYTACRDKLRACYVEVAKADVVVVTLGYTESWFDTQDGIYVNRSPGANIKTVKRGERYQFHNMSSAQVIDCLEGIVQELEAQTEGRAKVILTTSPVPLHGTFTDKDVIMANQYSKATLLSAAVQVSDRYDFVDYFPSYEIVMNSDRASTWVDDGVHIKPEIVAGVMDSFVHAYFDVV